MIQRIQSVFLLLASVSAFLLFYFPIWAANISFFIYESEVVRFSVWDSFALRALASIIGSISFINIFIFKKRKIQLFIGWLNIALTFAFVATVYFISKQLDFPIARQMITVKLFFGTYLPILIFVFTLLANFFIIRDERKVKSMDRLR